MFLSRNVSSIRVHVPGFLPQNDVSGMFWYALFRRIFSRKVLGKNGLVQSFVFEIKLHKIIFEY